MFPQSPIFQYVDLLDELSFDEAKLEALVFIERFPNLPESITKAINGIDNKTLLLRELRKAILYASFSGEDQIQQRILEISIINEPANVYESFKTALQNNDMDFLREALLYELTDELLALLIKELVHQKNKVLGKMLYATGIIRSPHYEFIPPINFSLVYCRSGVSEALSLQGEVLVFTPEFCGADVQRLYNLNEYKDVYKALVTLHEWPEVTLFLKSLLSKCLENKNDWLHRILLERGLKPTFAWEKRTPLMCSIANNQTALVSLLLKKGAHADITELQLAIEQYVKQGRVVNPVIYYILYSLQQIDVSSFYKTNLDFLVSLSDAGFMCAILFKIGLPFKAEYAFYDPNLLNGKNVDFYLHPTNQALGLCRLNNYFYSLDELMKEFIKTPRAVSTNSVYSLGVIEYLLYRELGRATADQEKISDLNNPRFIEFLIIHLSNPQKINEAQDNKKVRQLRLLEAWKAYLSCNLKGDTNSSFYQDWKPVINKLQQFVTESLRMKTKDMFINLCTQYAADLNDADQSDLDNRWFAAIFAELPAPEQLWGDVLSLKNKSSVTSSFMRGLFGASAKETNRIEMQSSGPKAHST